MPFPSAGCQTCKIRRIKCDDTKPTCRRCAKSRRLCLGKNAKQASFSIHIENRYASGRTKRPRGPRSSLTAASMSIVGAIRQLPELDLQTRALAYYLHYHLQTLTDLQSISKSLSDYVPGWKSNIQCVIVDLAISSMALAVYSRTQQHRPAAIEASSKYQQLLQVAQATIPTLSGRNIDACLLAIFLMSRYETAMHNTRSDNSKTPFGSSLRSFSHHDGAMAILKIWKDHLSHSQLATDTIKQTRRGLIRSALLRSLSVPEWMVKGSFFGEHGLELDYDRIIVRIVNLRHQMSLLLRQKTGPQIASHGLNSIAQELNNDARDIDELLQDWTTQFPSTWCYQRYILKEPHHWPRRHFYSSTVYSYSSPAYAAVWNKYFATRMLINGTRLRILELICPSSNDSTYGQQFECYSNMKLMASDLASSIPFCLEKFKVLDQNNPSFPQDLVVLNTNKEIKPHLASLAVWPLSIASSLEALDVEQKIWFRTELACLGRTIGIGMFEYAETDQWFRL